jgi:hypothetical protein
MLTIGEIWVEFIRREIVNDPSGIAKNASHGVKVLWQDEKRWLSLLFTTNDKIIQNEPF